jgi:hypothetical protein
MTRTSLTSSFLLLIFFVASCGNKTATTKNSNVKSAAPTVEKKTTAKEAFQLAEAEAKKWRNDVRLYAISQRGVLQKIDDPQFGPTFDYADVKTGVSRRWIIEFFSAKTLEVTFAEVLDGKVELNPSSKFGEQPQYIKGKWIDSTDALKVARAEVEKRLKITEDKYMALSNLKWRDDIPAWTVTFSEKDGDKVLWGIMINASSGKIEASDKPPAE